MQIGRSKGKDTKLQQCHICGRNFLQNIMIKQKRKIVVLGIGCPECTKKIQELFASGRFTSLFETLVHFYDEEKELIERNEKKLQEMLDSM